MGRPQSFETRAKISAAKMGNTVWLGRHHSEESKARMSISMMGNKSRLGIPHSAETRAMMSASHMGITHVFTPEARANMAAALMGHMVSPETRAKISRAQAGPLSRLWRGGATPEKRRGYLHKEKAKRRGLGYVYLNPWFLGCEGHHVDNEQVINMPHALHRSIYHRQTDGRGMAKINAVAYNFLFQQEVVAALKEA